jgi:tRNA dimethylallyltransferase
VGALIGPTASGKSALALALAATRSDVELVSLDALQVYRGMDVGTAKPSAAERAAVPHHLIDLVDPDEEMTVARFQAAYRTALSTIAARGHRALVVGGTGLYLRACLDDLEIPGRYPDVAARLDAEADTAALHARLLRADPVAAARMEPTNRRRILRALEVTEGSGRPFSSYGPGLEAYPTPPCPLVGLRMERPVLDARIEARITRQLDAGWLDEVRGLVARPGGWSRTAAQALGYRELADHLAGTCTLEEAVAATVARTRRFARRQERWFRRDPRIRWVTVDVEPLDHLEEPLDHLDEVVAALQGPREPDRPAGPDPIAGS